MLAQDWHGDNHIVKIVLHGFHGAVTVKGEQFNNVMAPWGKVLKDEQIAAVLTYVRNEWGNKAPPITKDFVAKIREQTKDRTEPWTQKELQATERVLVQDAGAAPAAAAGAAPSAANAGAPANAGSALQVRRSRLPRATHQRPIRKHPLRLRQRRPGRLLRRPHAPAGNTGSLSVNVPNRPSLEEVEPQAARERLRFASTRSAFRGFVYFLLAVFVGFSSALAEPRTDNLYWVPPNFTTGGAQIDAILHFIFWLTLVVFIAVQAVFIVYLVKYRRRPGHRAYYCHGNNVLEIVWTSIPVLIFLGLAIYSNRLWAELHSDPPPDALQVNVSAFQFGWDFRYPGADGKLGTVEINEISNENKFGVVEADAAGKDDFTSTELVIPFGKPINIVLNSRDVIHSFYVPFFRLYQDAVPGRTISWVWFKVERPGNFELACSQLCGTGHYNMKAPIRVVSQEEYDKWYAGKVQAAATAKAQEGTTPSEVAAK